MYNNRERQTEKDNTANTAGTHVDSVVDVEANMQRQAHDALDRCINKYLNYKYGASLMRHTSMRMEKARAVDLKQRLGIACIPFRLDTDIEVGRRTRKRLRSSGSQR